MVSFDVAALALGAGSSRPLDDKWLDFYRKVACLVSGDDEARFIGEPRRASAISLQTLGKSPERVYPVLARALRQTKADAGIVIVDLASSGSTGMVRGAPYLHIARAIVGQHDERPRARTVVLLGDMPPREDVFFEVLQPLIDAGRVVLIAEDGRSTAELLDSSYRRARLPVRGDAIDLFKRRLVTRRGWFPADQREGEEGVFLRHYFDLDFDFDAPDRTGELSSLLLDYFDKHASAFNHIAYDTMNSKWLEQPLVAACVSRQLDVSRMEDLDASEGGDVRQWLLVVPLTDTGRRVASMVRKLERRTSASVIRVLSILSTNGSEETRGSRRLRVDGRDVDVDYFLKVRQERVPSQSKACDPARMSIPESSTSPDTSRILTPYEFWDLVRAIGVRLEINIPPWRDSNDSEYVPDIPALLRNYGPWLAKKVWQAVHPAVRGLPEDVVFVGPRDEAGSDTLAEYLERSVGASVVQVPRSVIDSVDHDPTPNKERAQHAWDNPKQSWCLELRSATAGSVVLFDDFTRSGRTLKALTHILGAGQLQVAAVCCLLDFAPGAERPWPVYSLYAWQRPDRQRAAT